MRYLLNPKSSNMSLASADGEQNPKRFAPLLDTRLITLGLVEAEDTKSSVGVKSFVIYSDYTLLGDYLFKRASYKNLCKSKRLSPPLLKRKETFFFSLVIRLDFEAF